MDYGRRLAPRTVARGRRCDDAQRVAHHAGDLDGDGDAVLGPRNSDRLPSFATLDVRVEYRRPLAVGSLAVALESRISPTGAINAAWMLRSKTSERRGVHRGRGSVLARAAAVVEHRMVFVGSLPTNTDCQVSAE